MKELKIECLKLAVSMTGTPKEALSLAKEMYQFVSH